jgi:hypothetical protein
MTTAPPLLQHVDDHLFLTDDIYRSAPLPTILKCKASIFFGFIKNSTPKTRERKNFFE